ncbi:MAG: hypothetical protein JXB88_25950 [Spirochaetales bacterium]|nr:hypothetical protein [Spirochaetales bacterium]
MDIYELYKKMSDSEKNNLRKSFKKILEESTLPLSMLSHNVFLQSINGLGNRNDWENLQKQEKADILSNRLDDEKFLKFLNVIAKIYIDGNCYCGKVYKIPGAEHFFQHFKPKKKIKTVLYLKMDVVSSTELVKKYSTRFSCLVDDIFKEILHSSGEFRTELVAEEGDALYFSFDNDSVAYSENCNSLVLFSIKTLHWLKHFNLFNCPLDDVIKLKIIGMSIPLLHDVKNTQKAVKRLTWLEKEYSEPDYIMIDETIAQHIGNHILSHFSTRIIPVDGLSTRFYSYTIDLKVEELC